MEDTDPDLLNQIFDVFVRDFSAMPPGCTASRATPTRSAR